MELELELIQFHMAQKPVLRGEVGCACVAGVVLCGAAGSFDGAVVLLGRAGRSSLMSIVDLEELVG